MNFLNNLTMEEIVTRVVALLIFAALQGAILAGLARAMGDSRPRHDGRLTLNPFPHLAVLGLAMAVLFRMGWIRPLRYDVNSNRLGRWGLVVIALGGPLLMLSAIPLADLLAPLVQASLPRTAGYVVLYSLQQFQIVCAGSVLLNLLPLPGLIGGTLLEAIWPSAEKRLQKAEPVVLVGLCVLLVLGWVPDFSPVLLDWLRLS
ncbi:hypothetical protein VW29_16470 [Devosia limi DSM 17137]|uniref:Peptidase family M50 n=1 Tax=Devosia limi DSM 17137 TaxID=1121477 RepID=A0A0F5LE08_9HYPH|nr:hypothetical protein [Devosia limi]KKB80606.1 hypothetical protein VW29_16470 [Devosia limi DSM 17137]SHE51320.1 hypothetical protein SAMN02745223_00599 [Devosia limi DSM 17137]